MTLACGKVTLAVAWDVGICPSPPRACCLIETSYIADPAGTDESVTDRMRSDWLVRGKDSAFKSSHLLARAPQARGEGCVLFLQCEQFRKLSDKHLSLPNGNDL